MSDSSDIEMQSAPEFLLKKTKKVPKQPKSPSEEIQGQKKLPTKVMIHEALVDLRKGTRKGSSLHAIKKYMAEKHRVDIEKINHIIKKLIKEGVESGTILQTKGIGASGSFRLATVNKTDKKKSKPKKTEENSEEKSEKPKKTKEKSETKSKKKTVNKENSKEEVQKVVKKKSDVSKAKKVVTKENNKKEGIKKAKVEKTKKKMADSAKNTPIKKKATMMKRKSIGSIIKAPKMRPKMKN